MGAGKSGVFLRGDGHTAGSGGIGETDQSFDGNKAIEDHRGRISRLKDFFCGRTAQEPEVHLSCHPECCVARWSCNEDARKIENRELMDAVCKYCEEFFEIATQCLVLARLDLSGPSSDVIRTTMQFEEASTRYLAALSDLHIGDRCKRQ